jgi:polyisoprenoid-binding protein YceI
MTTNLSTDVRAGSYRLDPHRSVCRFTVTHVFGLKPVTGTMAVIGGAVTIADDPERSIASAELDAASFRTDDPRRDGDVRGRRFLDTGAYPEIGFRSTGLRRVPDGWRLSGVLAVRGGGCDVTLDLVTVEPAGDGCHVVARCAVDRVAAGVGAGRMLIARTVHVELDLQAVPARNGHTAS